jgi:formyltetrahydrofolate deformylase
MKTLILLFQCRDQRGIVAKVSDFIFRHNGNIITADQHSTDPKNGHFFIRIEFVLKDNNADMQSLGNDLSCLAQQFNAGWKLYDRDERLRMGILVSKPDHCLADLLYLWKSGELKTAIPFVISNYQDHSELVAQYGIPFHFIPAQKQDRKEGEIVSLVKQDSDFLVLARYMLVLSGEFLKSYGKDVINIHHSFLPSFKGRNPYHQAYERGVKVIGATAHFVAEDLDEGAIISQVVEPVSHRDDANALMRKGKNLEKRALSNAITCYLDYRIIKYQNKTIVF